MTTQQTDYRKVAARMRADLDRADITGRARRLAEFCIKATLGHNSNLSRLDCFQLGLERRQ